MRLLKKFIRKLYHLIWFLSLILFFIPDVYAADNSINGAAYGTDLILPSYAIFMNNFGSSISRVSTYVASNGFYDYADYTTLANSYGGGIAFNTNNTLRGNSFYAFTIYVGMENGGTSLSSVYAVHSSVSDRVVVASSFDGIIDRYSRNDYNAIYVTSKDFLNPIIIKNSSTLSNFSGVLQYIIKVGSAGGNFVFIPYTTNVNFYNRHIFFGYSIEFLGSQDNGITIGDVRTAISQSGLASANSVSQVQQGVNEVKSQLNSIDSTLKDSSVDSSDSTINSLKNRIPTNSVISDLLLLPVRFLQNFVNALGSSCSTFSLGSLYGTNLFMPCINLQNYLGSAIWTTIDLIISGFFIYYLRKKFIEIYQNLTNLKDGGNEVD